MLQLKKSQARSTNQGDWAFSILLSQQQSCKAEILQTGKGKVVKYLNGSLYPYDRYREYEHVIGY